MALLHYLWSRIAANNATADSAVNWAEGQAPSSVNDSARALMASAAGFRDDIAGAIVTGGTSTAYTVTSYQIFDTLAHMNGQLIAFTPHTANGATVTLNVDGLGAKPLRPSTGVELQSNVLIAGTPYMATYNNSDAVWYLHGIGGNPYGVPLLGGMDFWGTTAPSSAFIFPTGQAINRTTYATAFALMGTTFGVGDGSTTFNVPDKTGRTSVMKEASATRLTTAGGGVDGATLGATGGAQNVTLAANQIPSLTSVNASQAITVSGTNATALKSSGPADNFGSIAGSGQWDNITQGVTISSTGNNSISVTYTNGSQVVTKTVMPAIICNYILRII